MRVIAIANQKGGCGKTTTSVNLAAAFGKKGNRVLAIDLDPQGHTTLGLGCDPESFTKTIYNAVVDPNVPIDDVIVPSKTENVDVAPSNVLLSGAELDLATVSGREFMLTEQFKTIDSKYDICVIDCPPSLGILTLNALIASTDLVVPVQVHYYAMEGLKQLFETCEIISEHFYPCKVKITGLLLTFVEDRLLFTRQISQQMREFFGDLVFDTVIHRNVRLAEAPSAGESVITYAPDSRGAVEYMALVDEILNGKEYVRTHNPSSEIETGSNSQADAAAAADAAAGATPANPVECSPADADAQTAECMPGAEATPANPLEGSTADAGAHADESLAAAAAMPANPAGDSTADADTHDGDSLADARTTPANIADDSPADSESPRLIAEDSPAGYEELNPDADGSPDETPLKEPLSMTDEVSSDVLEPIEQFETTGDSAAGEEVDNA